MIPGEIVRNFGCFMMVHYAFLELRAGTVCASIMS